MKRDTRAGSLPYMEAGEAMRLSQARLVEARANLRAWRVAAAVWGLTAGYSKRWDAVFVDGLAALTGMDSRSVRRGIKECAECGALQWLPSRGGAQDRRPSLVGLPEATGPSKPGSEMATGPSKPGSEMATGPSKPGRETNRAAVARAATALLPCVDVEALSDAVSLDAGEHRSSLSATPTPTSSDVWVDWEAERPAQDQEAAARCPVHGEPLIQGRCVDCDLEGLHRRHEEHVFEQKLPPAPPPGGAVERFGEMTPSAVTDTEAHRMRRR
jgi:hypothetical protein